MFIPIGIHINKVYVLFSRLLSLLVFSSSRLLSSLFRYTFGPLLNLVCVALGMHGWRFIGRKWPVPTPTKPTKSLEDPLPSSAMVDAQKPVGQDIN